MAAKVVPLPIRTKLVCSACGADGEGTCNCGVGYVPASVRVAEYDEANPGKSTRQAAASARRTDLRVAGYTTYLLDALGI